MATYSALFSSGLLAPRIARCTTPALPSSPVAVSPSPVDPVDRQLSVTPTPLGQISPCPKAPEAQTNAERPRMRRRRSSVNIGASPMALIKSPVRNAGAALQRTGLMSPTRHRAGSVSMHDASEDNSLFGRLRSGSMGGVVNPPKRLRRAIRAPVPFVPPPNAPLPALPPLPAPKGGVPLLPPVILGPTPRQPLTTNSRTDGIDNVYSPTLPSPTLLNPGYTSKIPFRLSTGFLGTHDDTINELSMEN